MATDLGHSGNQLVFSLNKVKQEIFEACKLANRNIEDIELIAVSKTQSAEKIEALTKEGHFVFGESYTQEFIEKAEKLKHLPIKWIFIGPMQSNKIGKIVKVAKEIQSVSTEKQAKYIARCVNENAGEKAIERFPIYIQVNAGDEKSKHGLALDRVEEFSSSISKNFPELEIQGIMAIPPFIYQDDTFTGKLPELYEKLGQISKRIGHGKLSLGMSGDLKMAILAGSTCVRIGTSIFGSRIL